MAWNDSGNNKDPWGGRDGDPNDLDKMVADLQKKLSGIFGGSGGGKGAGRAAGGGLMFVVAVAVFAWLMTGWYRIDEAERGLELRFGKFMSQTGPGLHWHFPFPIESVETVNAAKIDLFEQEIKMLTADENFVVISLAVQYRRSDPIAYQFNVRDPIDTVSDVSESAIREAVGTHPLDFTLLGNRGEIASQTKELIQRALDTYEAGIEVTAVNLQDVQFPGQVRSAVQDAVKAREEKEQAQLSAQTYENKVIPEARGGKARTVESAEAYKAQVIIDAEGDVARFRALVAEYKAAPRVTRERLYIEAIEHVYANSRKVFIDAEGTGNLLYLPIDKLTGNDSLRPANDSVSGSTRRPQSADTQMTGGSTQTEDPRARRTR